MRRAFPGAVALACMVGAAAHAATIESNIHAIVTQNASEFGSSDYSNKNEYHSSTELFMDGHLNKKADETAKDTAMTPAAAPENKIAALAMSSNISNSAIVLAADQSTRPTPEFLTDAQYWAFSRTFKKSFDAQENVEAIKRTGKVAPGDEIDGYNRALKRDGYSGSYQNWTVEDYAHYLKVEPKGYNTLLNTADAARCGVASAQEAMTYLSPNGNWKSYHNLLVKVDIALHPQGVSPSGSSYHPQSYQQPPVDAARDAAKLIEAGNAVRLDDTHELTTPDPKAKAAEIVAAIAGKIQRAA